MATNPLLIVEKPTDIVLVETFCQVVHAAFGARVTSVVIDTNAGPGHLSYKTMAEANAVLNGNPWNKFKTEVLSKRFISITKVTLHLEVPEINPKAIATCSGIEARLSLESSSQTPPPQMVINLLEAALAAFKPLVPAGIPAPASDDPRLTYYDALAARMSESVTRLQETLGAESAKLIERSKQQADEAQAKLATEMKRLRDDFSAKEDALSAERKAFDDERRKLNDRVNTHVRRDLQLEIRAEFAKYQQIKLSSATNRKTWPIYIAFAFALVGLGTIETMLVQHVIDRSSGGTADWHVYLPLAGTTLILVSLFTYFIRWNLQWLRQHANFEFRNIQYNYDMLRASWFAEMFFEYKNQDKALPESVIAVLTKNLFEIPSDTLADAKHPADDLVEFVKKLKTVKVGTDSVEVSSAGNKAP